MFKLCQIAHNIFKRPLCRTNFFWSGPTFGSSRSWSHNIKCRTTYVAHTIHTTTTTTRFMSHNHVVLSHTTKFLSVWTHLKICEKCSQDPCKKKNTKNSTKSFILRLLFQNISHLEQHIVRPIQGISRMFFWISRLVFALALFCPHVESVR